MAASHQDPTLSSRKSKVTPIGDALNELLRLYHLDRQYHEQRIVQSWEEIMGLAIAKRTTSLYIRDKILYVHLNSAPLRQDLNMSKGKVLAHVHTFCGQQVVEEVVFL